MATIKHKRGTRAALDASPGLQQGELGLCTDTGELFIGNNGNHPILEQVAAKTLMGNTGSDKALPSAIPAADILKMIGGQAVIQYEVMPATVTEGAVVQYVGEDTAEYVSGSWYRGEGGTWALVSGSGGVYVGSGDMPDGYNVQIDPSGEVFSVEEIVDTTLEQAKASGEFDGYTPQRGIDYWTDEDIAEIKRYVDEAILGGAW